MSALTTLRLMGSPTKPGWPYCRPCCVWRSCAGDVITPGVCVGEAGGRCCVWVGNTSLAATASKLVRAGVGSFGAAKLPMPLRQISNRTSVVLFVAEVSRGK